MLPFRADGAYELKPVARAKRPAPQSEVLGAYYHLIHEEKQKKRHDKLRQIFGDVEMKFSHSIQVGELYLENALGIDSQFCSSTLSRIGVAIILPTAI